jgi:hypothetical protein
VTDFLPAIRPKRKRHVIVVKKYISPPDGRERRWCREIDEREYHCHWAEYEPPPRGSVPDEVSVEITERMTYGRFVAILSYAWYGGAGTVHMNIG